MRREHRMPFGARLDGQGALFRLWAPAAKSVALRLSDAAGDVPMAAAGDGWYEVRQPRAGAGLAYRYVIDGGRAVPDPASRFQPDGIDGPSRLVDPTAFDWPDAAWRGRPWHQAVIYELHVGTFTREGTFAALEADLERLANLGVTAIELMPLAQFGGTRNWGYDGVLPFAPASCYGDPPALKRLIAAAHRRELMVFLDVVYNHFGPEGNYLGVYAPQFFTPARTDWGAAINFANRTVRDFFIANALYWILEYHLDGLRFDAVHAIRDEGRPHILDELAARVRNAVAPGRHVHLVLENDRNEAHWLARDAGGGAPRYDAQWNDDFHHAAHVVLTGERDGYYADYADRPVARLGRALAEGFVYQGERSAFRAAPRGEPSTALPPLAFVNFLQNHDQIGNRAFGERLSVLAPPAALAAATAILLLAPAPPLLFMGEEWDATTPFLFFCDFGGALGAAVRDGRRGEFAKFPAFAGPEATARIPDPLDVATYRRSRLQDCAPGGRPRHNPAIHRLLQLRRTEIAPRLPASRGGARFAATGTQLNVAWRLGDGSALALIANLGAEPVAAPPAPPGRVLWGPADLRTTLPPWTVIWRLAGALA